VEDILANLCTDETLWDNMEITVAQMDYSGFEPKSFMLTLLKKGQTAGRTKAEMIGDLRDLAVLGCVRGNNLKKMKDHCTPELATFINLKTQIYGLVSKATGRDSATLGRIGIIMAQLMSEGYYAKKITKFPAGLVVPGLPAGLNLPTMGGLLPTIQDPEENMILCDAYCMYQHKFDAIINSKSIKAAPLTNTQGHRKASVDQFFRTQYESQLFSEPVRHAHASKIGLIQRVAGVTSLVPAIKPGLLALANEWRAIN